MELKPGYKQTEVGVIPEDWKISNIGDVASIIDPQPDHRTPPEQIGGEPYIGISDFINDNSVDWYRCRQIISRAVDKQLASFKIHEGDIIFGKIGTIGSPKFVPIVPFRYALSANIILIKPRVNAHFVMSWLKSDLVHRLINQELHSTSQAAFGINKMRSLQIPLPPTLAEQRAIAEALSDADAFIESLEQLIAKQRAVKQGAMQELLRPKEGWLQKKLGSLGTFLKGSGVRKDDAQSGNTPCVRYGEIYTKHNDYIKAFYSWISSSVAATARLLKTGDILFAGSGETKEEIGKCVAFIDETVAYAGGDIVILRPEKANSMFLGYYLNTGPINRQKASRGQGDAVVHIAANALADIDLALPIIEEQTAIAAVLSDMDAAIAALETKLDKARQVKQGMMQELLTGKTRLL